MSDYGVKHDVLDEHRVCGVPGVLVLQPVREAGMDMSGISTLTPEERAALKAALDEAEKPDPVAQLSGAVEMLCADNQAMREEIASLKKLVMEDIIGGVKEAYEGNVRTERMGAFKGKFGPMLDPLAEAFKRTFGADLHEKAFDYMDGLRGEEGYTDEMGDSKMSEVIAQIKEKLGLSDPAPIVAEVAEVKPAEGEAEEEPVDDETQTAWDEIAAMKDREPRDMRNRNKPAQKKGA
jgi:hypothetical protein